ncbi:MAG: cysteine desulfurase [Cytophagia bacterium]|nr:cysteine desulfurase [Cytophagia bacterium]
MNLPLYFDYASTTPVRSEVLHKMLPYFSTLYGNAGSNLHHFGWLAQEAIDLSRNQIADYFDVKPSSIIYTSGATESNNLAIKGFLKGNPKGHLITSAIEHKAVLEIFGHLEQEGYRVTYLMPDEVGQITKEDLTNALQDDTVLVSLMMVNNEIGTISDYVAFKQICDAHDVCFHSDATQAIGKIKLDLTSLPHLMSFSGHKIYAPKGIGGLLVNNHIKINPLFDGGGQERGIRSGTLPVPLIVGLGYAFTYIPEILSFDQRLHIFNLSIKDSLLSNFKNNILINSNNTNNISSILSMSVQGVHWEDLFNSLTTIAISNGSACNVKATNPSHVLTALGHKRDLALSTLRISLSYMTTEKEIDFLIHYLNEKLRKLLV